MLFIAAHRIGEIVLQSIPYTVVPAPSKYNLAAFLLNFNHRKDSLTMKDAFQHDFDMLVPSHIATTEEMINYIMTLR